MKKGGLYVLGHVTSGDLAAVEEDPITKVGWESRVCSQFR